MTLTPRVAVSLRFGRRTRPQHRHGAVAGSPKRLRSPPRAGWVAATRTRSTRPRSTRCATACRSSRWTASSSSARAKRTKRRCCTSASASATARSRKVDVAVDPVDGTTLLSKGLPNAVSVVALAERGTMYYPPGIVYMEKLAVGPAGRGVVSLEMSIEENIEALASAKGERVDDLTVVVLDRPRHAELIERIRATGARIKLISRRRRGGRHHAVAARYGRGHADGRRRLARGGAHRRGAEVPGRRHPVQAVAARRQASASRPRSSGWRWTSVLTIDDLVRGNDVFFALTGVTDGELVKGVHYFPHGATTETLVMRSRVGHDSSDPGGAQLREARALRRPGGHLAARRARRAGGRALRPR